MSASTNDGKAGFLAEIRSDIAACVTAACILEVLAPKVGNVHPSAAFPDLDAGHFARASIAIARPLANVSTGGIGRAVLSATRAMRHAAGTNTHLGIILLLAPLSTPHPPTTDSVADALDSLTPEDAAAVYQAIRIAQPGGLGQAERHDVYASPPRCLLEAMQSAADRDLIARQYANSFRDLFDFVVPRLTDRRLDLLERIVRTHVALLAELGDSLIARKCGIETAREAQQQAAAALDRLENGDPAATVELDRWLRADGNRRNPGATADLIAAGLFIGLRHGMMT